MQKRTDLYDWHSRAGAKLVSFAGWEMPLYYQTGAIAEHHLVRRGAGLFDISHMARFFVSGTGATAFLQRLVSANVQEVPHQGSTYALLCKPDGGVLDDLFLYRMEDRGTEDSWLVVANAANEERDFAWLSEHCPNGVKLENVSRKIGMVAVQGPGAVTLLDGMVAANLAGIERFHSTRITLGGAEMIAGRTGYTGEDGFELFPPSEKLEQVWTSILERAAAEGIEAGPIGLAARDSLRFEPGFALYGHEIGEEVTPVEARLTWACDLEVDFIGRDAIAERKKTGAEKKLCTLVMDERGVPREGHTVLSDGEVVGTVVTGLYAPTVDGYCANVFLLSEFAKRGTVVEVDIRGKGKRASVAKRPLYTPAYR
jgi:aminomethyltransferase